ncbi:MAG: alpha/beta fold hydrolase [Burkholderiaceae bacterium]
MSETVDQTLSRLEASARKVPTPCGQGSLMWRTWGEGRPLVLVHGGSGSWQHWVRNIDAFAAHRQVWCPDTPYYGDSADPPEPGGMPGIAQAFAQGYAQLFSGVPVDVIAFSFGSLVTCETAALRPGLIDRLILVGAASHGLPRHDIGLQPWKAVEDAAARYALHRDNLHRLMLSHPVDDEGAVRLHVRAVEAGRFNSRRLAFSTRNRDLIGSLQVRQLDAIYGEHDPTAGTDLAALQALFEAQRPGLRFSVVPDAGHWVPYERPQAFMQAVQAHWSERAG